MFIYRGQFKSRHVQDNRSFDDYSVHQPARNIHSLTSDHSKSLIYRAIICRDMSHIPAITMLQSYWSVVERPGNRSSGRLLCGQSASPPILPPPKGNGCTRHHRYGVTVIEQVATTAMPHSDVRASDRATRRLRGMSVQASRACPSGEEEVS